MSIQSLFPDCIIHDMPQRSDEWHAIRHGKLTASGAGEWLAERPSCRMTVDEIRMMLDALEIGAPSKAKRDELLALLPEEHRILTITEKSASAKENAVAEIIGAMAKVNEPDPFEVDPEGPPPRNPELWAIWNGIRLEKDARADFERWCPAKIIEVGFCLHKSSIAGCSPDGLIEGQSIGFETKSPLPKTHALYFLNVSHLRKKYGMQCHFSMAVTGARAWWLQSYCPGLPTVRTLFLRNEKTEAICQGIAEFAEEVKAAKQKAADMFDAAKREYEQSTNS